MRSRLEVAGALWTVPQWERMPGHPRRLPEHARSAREQVRRTRENARSAGFGNKVLEFERSEVSRRSDGGNTSKKFHVISRALPCDGGGNREGKRVDRVGGLEGRRAKMPKP